MFDSKLLADVRREGEEANFDLASSESQPEEKDEELSETQEVEENQQEETPSSEEQEDLTEESVPEVESSEELTSEKKPLPFHKHPRFRRMIKENKELKGQLQELTSLMGEIKESAQKNSHSQQEASVVPPEFQRIFGDDYEAYKLMAQMTQSQAKEIAEKIVAEQLSAIEQEENKEQQFHNEFVEWAEEQLGILSDELGVDLTSPDSTERNQILDICEKYGVLDHEGRYDFRAANALRIKLYPKKKVSEERKKIAANTDQTLNESSSEQDTTMTPSKLRKASLKSFFKNNS